MCVCVCVCVERERDWILALDFSFNCSSKILLLGPRTLPNLFNKFYILSFSHPIDKTHLSAYGACHFKLTKDQLNQARITQP